MKAIRVRSHDRRSHMLHWLADDNWTECGRQLKNLDVVDRLDLIDLYPHPEACEVCEELRTNPALRRRPRPQGVMLPPSTGRLFTDGPLYHGVRKDRRGGRRL